MSEPSQTVFAPGKLVLVGEYAVLDGAPAVVLAIDRGVACDITPSADTVQITTPDADTRFVAPALEGASPGHYVFRSWNPVQLPGKPGFGGSAAACVAACVAAGRPPTDALSIHHTVQGSGSGVDVLASIHGGMGRCIDGEWTALPPIIPVVTFAGQSARTGPRVQQYRRWSGPNHARFVEESTRLASRFEHAPVDTFRQAWRRLTTMAEQAEVPYRTPAIDFIVNAAEALGGGAKPSGAGAGDCTVALFSRERDAVAFREQMDAAGFPCIAVSPAAGAHRVDRPLEQG